MAALGPIQIQIPRQTISQQHHHRHPHHLSQVWPLAPSKALIPTSAQISTLPPLQPHPLLGFYCYPLLTLPARPCSKLLLHSRQLRTAFCSLMQVLDPYLLLPMPHLQTAHLLLHPQGRSHCLISSLVSHQCLPAFLQMLSVSRQVWKPCCSEC